MILFTVLVCALVISAVIGLISAIIAGTGFFLAFGDLLVCALLIYLIVKLFTKKKKES